MLHCLYLRCVDVISSAGTQLLQHNSLGDIKASVLYVKQRKGSRLLCICSSVNCHFRIDLGFLPHNKMYEHVILSNLSEDTGMLCTHEFIITTLNEEKCIKNLSVRKASDICNLSPYLSLSLCVCFCTVKRQFDI